MSISDVGGFAIRRNGSCPRNEIDCGQTEAPFHACCPTGFQCPTAYNIDCCPLGSGNCTETIIKKPACVNSSWSLFNNNGYFCCAADHDGYNIGNTDACAPPGEVPTGGMILKAVSLGSTSTSFISESTSLPVTHTAIGQDSKSTSSPPSSPSTSSSSSTASNTNAGAIAGGVVGGVAAVALIAVVVWFLRRKIMRQRGGGYEQRGELAVVDSREASVDYAQGVGQRVFAEKVAASEKPAPRELDSKMMHELPATEKRDPVELP